MNKCPYCKKLGQRSKLHVMGSGQTLIGTMPYYDEDGVFQDNDANHRWTDYKCSEGHLFKVLRKGQGPESVTLMRAPKA